MATPILPPARDARFADWPATVQGISDSLVERALAGADVESLVGGLCRQLLGAGIAIRRVSLGVTTLHPLYEAATFLWHREEGQRTIRVVHGSSKNEAWRRSPHFYMLENGLREMRCRVDGSDAPAEFPILEDFRREGATEYLAFVIPFDGRPDALLRRDGMATSFVTDHPDGFTDEQVAALRRLQPRIGLGVKMAVREQTTLNILSAYVGTTAGRRVLDGLIRLGDAESLDAVIWYSDLRDSSVVADRLPAREFLAFVNRYFECTAGAVLDHGGEVLRFVGDAVLAIFPIAGPGGADRAARMAVAAAREARQRADRHNAAPPEGMPVIEFGLGIHRGEVLFGNIGVPDRVEFSVVGPAANEVARLEGLTKTLESWALASADFAALTPQAWRPLGAHRLRGIATPEIVYALV